jgi:hypothetical protein
VETVGDLDSPEYWGYDPRDEDSVKSFEKEKAENPLRFAMGRYSSNNDRFHKNVSEQINILAKEVSTLSLQRGEGLLLVRFGAPGDGRIKSGTIVGEPVVIGNIAADMCEVLTTGAMRR